MKYFAALISLFYILNSVSGQEFTCDYRNGTINSVPAYYCLLTANNPNGAENITSIGGQHLEGFTDADVFGVFSRDGISTNVPTVFCTQFTNLVELDLSGLRITNVAANSFNACTNLLWLRLYFNNISSLPANVFSNTQSLEYLDLDTNQLTTLPENIFANLGRLDMLELRNNPFQNIPASVFNGLSLLQTLYLQNTRLTEINNAWFQSLPNLSTLTVYGNNITSISETAFNGLSQLRVLEISRNPLGQNIHVNAFAPLTNLQILYMSNINLSVINPQLFAPLSNLITLYFFWNNIVEIPSGTFDNMTNLFSLDIGGNLLDETSIAADAFRNLQNLVIFFLDDNYIQNLNPQWFANLTNVEDLFLDFNFIEDLPNGIFAPIRELWQIGLWFNDLKTIRRNAFGNLNGLYAIDLDQNVINAVDENFFNASSNLYIIYFFQNLCASISIYGFSLNRENSMSWFRRCTENFLFIVDAETDGNENYEFHPGRSPGIQMRVQSNDEVHVALTPFNFPWTPMIEIIIGAANNTRSIIRRNQETDVVTVPTPGIIRAGQWNGFRITWANHAILVWREGEEWPFMGFTMTDFFPVNFYGLRAPLSRASWSVQPVDGIVPTIEENLELNFIN
ncbi:hypothetical protein PVAND_016492 [Polypedilum vanderplanki]|uniref:Farnesoic acid O-methyl transferase domain-containing protein n=1 Tax=Polypedilum vanderplanki TaxID=319348 RepID=A0A9J6BFR6_POLVA|nr:hypothetical protein PVAND_016492 [Polypedilum vanderplanki]